MDQSPPRAKPNKLRRTQSMSFQPPSNAPEASMDPTPEADILPSFRSKDNLKQISADTVCACFFDPFNDAAYRPFRRKVQRQDGLFYHY